MSKTFVKPTGRSLIRIAPLFVLVFLSSVLFSQGFNQKYDVYLIGQITSLETGAPIKGQEVLIETDTIKEPGFYYSNIVYTDHEGYFYDTLLTTLEKGSITVTTYDFEETRYDTTVHYRFRWEETNILFPNFVIKTENIINTYQANFYYVRNPLGANNLEYKFYDLTNSPDVIAWNWDFGDGTFSSLKNPMHAYEDGGLYKVVLTVCIHVNGVNQISSITKIINAAEEIYFHMGGHVFAGSFPIDKSDVFLYKIENDELIPIDTAVFNDTLGYYLFYQLIEGEYIVKADLHPSSELFDLFMTTYYSDKLHWDEADTIYHHQTSFEYDINLAPNTQSSAAGPGCIQGGIAYDPSYYGGGKSAPAENITILLYDEFNQPATICHSDENGQFSLDDLNLQKYFVYAEVTGKYTIPVEVELEQSNTEIISVTILINQDYVSGAVNLSVEENLLEQGLSEVFPNPAENTLNLTYSGEGSNSISFEILNSNGQILNSGQLQTRGGSGPLILNVANLRQGFYFIRLWDDSGRSASRKFLKK